MPANIMRRLAATTAVAMAFSPLANAAGLISDNASVVSARTNMSVTLAKATGDDVARARAGGFMVELEKALASPAEKTRLVVYPQENSTNMLVIAAVVPPKGFENLPIPVCAQKDNKVVGAWNITAKGDVLPRAIADNPEGSTKGACDATVKLANRELKDQMAAAQPAN